MCKGTACPGNSTISSGKSGMRVAGVLMDLWHESYQNARVALPPIRLFQSFTLLLAEEQRVVQPACGNSPGQRTDPVDAVVVPVIRRQRRTKGPRGIERCAGR